jgi:hypothetical protein
MFRVNSNATVKDVEGKKVTARVFVDTLKARPEWQTSEGQAHCYRSR